MKRYQAVSSERLDGAPESIQWMPAGTHEIHATRGGRPERITVHVTEECAVVLNEQLQAALQAADRGEASRPFIDFGHEHDEAAAIPVEFFWHDGIRLRLEWTEAGRQAIEGRSYSYFSPEFALDEQGRPAVLPTPGAIGGLVNEPAFQQIERIAAQLNEENMDEIQKLKDQLAERDAEIEQLKKQLAEAADKIEARRREAIEGKVDALIQAGRITATGREVMIEACMATDDDGERIAAALPAARLAPRNPPLAVGAQGYRSDDSRSKAIEALKISK